MPQGIAINRMNTPRSIPQAALQKVQLQVKQVNNSQCIKFGLIYF